MKKKFIAIAMVTTLLFVFGGCVPLPTVSAPLPENTPPEPDSTKLPIMVAGDKTYSDITYVEDKGMPVLAEGFGIYGSTVEFEGVFPGWAGTVPLTIVNGQDKERLFVLEVNSATKTKEGFEPFPEEYFYWITISEPEVTVKAGETYQIPITLEIPADADYAGRNAEVRIRIADTTQTGLVQIALDNRWFITTAE